MSVNPNKVIIPCRFSYLHCWEPDSVNGSEPKYFGRKTPQTPAVLFWRT